MDKSEQIANILSLLLDKKIDKNDDVSMGNCDTWDSMKHIEIITTIEEELNISFEIEEIPTLNSMQAIIKKVEDMD